MARRYEMAGRAAAKQRTREEILDAAVELFTPAWFDEVTIADVAARAGMWHQLRREEGLDVAETQDHLVVLVQGLLA